MPNPLRLPLVLIVVFTTMLTYVHQHHRRHARDTDAPLFEHDDESLQLRQSTGPQQRATLAGPAWLVPPSGTPAARDGAAADPEPATRLPGLSDPAAPLQDGSQAAVTLWPPDSAYARRNSAANTAHDRSASESRVPETRPWPAGTASHTAARPREVMHRIVDGDTLPRLAETYLGDASRYGELLEANRDVLVHPDLLPLGVRIRIPLGDPHK